MTDQSRPDLTLTDAWDNAYQTPGWTPWDIGRPQPAFERLARAGELRSPLLDSGCGTGEHALMAAAHGLEAVGLDIAPTAVARARAKAAERGLEVELVVGSALELAALGRQFATVLDCGVFHIFSDPLRERYVASLASVTQPGSVLHLLCFSDLTPGDIGPRRITQQEIRDAFREGWVVERIEPERFEVNQVESRLPERPHAWLSRIVRLDTRGSEQA
ncbi:MAG TPA: class I SAM-dependent methyltransferase [Candidatus Limnocylindria bacterium]